MLNKLKQSFSLMEISVVIAVLAVLSALSFSSGKYILKQNKLSKNEQKIELIQQVLKDFFKQNGRLPRPADYSIDKLSDSYGKEKSVKSSYDVEIDGDFYTIIPEHEEEKPVYQEVEYIHKTGKQSIDLHYVPNANTKIYIKYMYTVCGGGVLIGNIPHSSTTFDDTKDYRFFFHGTCTNLSLDIGSNRLQSSTSLSLSNSTIYETTIGNFYIQDSKFGNLTKEATSNFPAINTIYYGQDDWNTQGNWQVDQAKLYALKIYENNMLIKNFIPVYLKEDIAKELSIDNNPHSKNEIGLWEIINNKFYPNITSTPFTSKGNNVNNGHSLKTKFIAEQSEAKVNVKYVMYRGIIPFKDLGLKEEDVVDEFGNYFEYYVPDIMTIKNGDKPYYEEEIIKDGYTLKNGNYGEYTKYPCVGNNTNNLTPSQMCIKNNNVLYGVKFKQNNLSFYQQVEWVENITNNSYIDTLYESEPNYFKISIKFMPVKYGYHNGYIIYRIWGSQLNSTTPFVWSNSGSTYSVEKLSIGNNTDTIVGLNKTYNEINEIELEANNNILNGYINELQINNKAYTGNLSNGTIYLFASHYCCNPKEQIAQSKIYYAKMWSSSQLVRDYIPVYLKQDITAEQSSDNRIHYKDEIGLWDKVDNKFYTYGNGTAFTKGADVEEDSDTQMIHYVQPPYGLRVKDAKTKNYIDINGSIAYVILSHGENGSKTCGIKYDKKNTINLSHNFFTTFVQDENIAEAQNCIDASTTGGIIGRNEFLSNINKEILFYSGNKNNNFDDVVHFTTLADLMSKKK